MRSEVHNLLLTSSRTATGPVWVRSNSEDFYVYTSGWGRLFSSCVTNELGPVRAIKCQFPFNSSQSMEYSCARKLTPSAKVSRLGDEREKFLTIF